MLGDKKIISTIAKFLVKNLIYREQLYIFLNKDVVKLARELGVETNSDEAYNLVYDLTLKYSEELSLFGITVNRSSENLYYNGILIVVPYHDSEFTG